MQKITVSAPGKIHLLGEHTVVHGKPALITAIDLRCEVSLISRNDSIISLVSKQVKGKVETNVSNLIKKTQSAHSAWIKFSQTNDVSLLKSISTEPLDYAQIIVGETLSWYKIAQLVGCELTIDSNIPIGGSVGSSAALAVTLVGALTVFLQKSWDKSIINEIAYRTEQKKHGFPSGGDNSTSCFGGLVWYRKESPELKIIHPVPFTLSKRLAQNFILIDTGKPQESTGEMVSAVRTLYDINPHKIQKIFDAQEKLTRELLSVIKNEQEEKLIEIIRVGQRNLEALKVCSPFVKGIVREIEKSSGVAKVCGGGGKTKGTGVVLIYHKEIEKVIKIANKYQLPCFQVALGVEGLKIEGEK